MLFAVHTRRRGLSGQKGLQTYWSADRSCRAFRTLPWRVMRAAYYWRHDNLALSVMQGQRRQLTFCCHFEHDASRRYKEARIASQEAGSATPRSLSFGTKTSEDGGS